LLKLAVPQKDSERLNLLRQSLIHSEKESMIRYLDPSITAALQEFVPDFEALILEYNRILAVRTGAIRSRTKSVDDLLDLIREYWSALRYLCARKNLPAEVFVEFGLPLNGKTPDLASLGQKLMLGKQVLVGHAAMMEKFSEFVKDPELAVIEAALTDALEKTGVVSDLEVALSHLQETLSKQRNIAGDLIGKIIHYLKYSMLKKPASQRRRIMRAHGLRFQTTDSELELEELPEEDVQNPELLQSSPVPDLVAQTIVAPEAELVAV
jgi:hypothetical protein